MITYLGQYTKLQNRWVKRPHSWGRLIMSYMSYPGHITLHLIPGMLPLFLVPLRNVANVGTMYDHYFNILVHVLFLFYWDFYHYYFILKKNPEICYLSMYTRKSVIYKSKSLYYEKLHFCLPRRFHVTAVTKVKYNSLVSYGNRW